MPCAPQLRWVVSFAALLSLGCAEPLHLMARNAGGGGPLIYFWPPPPSTSTWRDPTDRDGTLREAAEHTSDGMHAAGYTDERWYAIGARYAHGFIVTTRLERLGDDGEATPTQERWSRRFPEASTLFWLEGARTMQLPARARYRVLLVAFTDLPIGPTRQAISRSEETWMAERPGSPATESPVTLRGPTGYHYGVYVYEYRSERSDGEGAFLSSDMTISGATLAPVAGLSPLVRVQSAER